LQHFHSQPLRATQRAAALLLLLALLVGALALPAGALTVTGYSPSSQYKGSP
jgi:hypothetical protein